VKTASEALTERFLDLVKDLDYDPGWNPEPNTPEELLAVGDYHLYHHDKLAAMDAEYQERVNSVLFNIVADELQRRAIEVYGSTEDEHIRQVFYDSIDQPEYQAYFKKLLRLGKEAIADCDLSDEQQCVIYQLYEALPYIMLEFILHNTRHLKLLPREKAPMIAATLAEMMTEAPV